MQNIRIERYEQDPTAQGVIRPADDRWQLVIGADGCPHLYVRVKYTLTPEEQAAMGTNAPDGAGWMALDDVLPDGSKTRDILDSTAGGIVEPEQAAAAWVEYEASRAAYPLPCPR